MADKKNMINDENLTEVNGGAGKSSAEFRARRKEFDDAWTMLKMDSKGFSGMKMAELYDEWELAGYSPDASTFLATMKA
ncbi:hypothetical protein [Butyrivibrio sp.]|jgi:hypothetical protein|uniref:hypothetical protein n=1 Tax=Butyrivibrio sp. TaxID=28121 RepID=UPI001B5B9DC6|nr:hypothetical protein [Butyrivibrio sp.]MBE5836791.1 hypothetical protein [Butyrivibrio sp.]MBP3817794.1 hypothetical protein [Butyrivibrio sp.]